jgi:hypothetical protein
VSSSKVPLVLSFDGTELTEGAYIMLTCTEPRVGQSMRISAYKNANCYYYNADGVNQQWQVHSVDPEDEKIRYGDGVVLTNIYYSPQRLVPKGGYLTTKAVSDTDSTWVITRG